MISTLQMFHQYAIARRLTGVQMQLWQCVYYLVQAYGQDVCIPTYHFLDTLGISRSQFCRARAVLAEAGLLQIRKNGVQRTYYTVLLDGKVVEFQAICEGQQGDVQMTESEKQKNNTQKKQDKKKQDKKQQDMTKTKHPSIPTGVAPQQDIVMNSDIEKDVETFVNGHGYSRLLQRKLLDWCDMRRANRWTLTMVGFAGTMNTLLQHSGGDEELMIKIIDRTLEHGWKGFHQYKIDAAPSGKAMKQNTSNKYHTSGKIPKYDTKKEDLDFLEW